MSTRSELEALNATFNYSKIRGEAGIATADLARFLVALTLEQDLENQRLKQVLDRVDNPITAWLWTYGS